MQLGAVFPTTEIGSDPAAIRDWAQAAEGLGLSRILAYDHVLGAEHADREPALTGPYTERDAFHEPFVLFGYLAAITSRVELATSVLILTQRQTALVAKQAAEVDLLSGGRMVLGVGTGWNWVEYESLGVPFAERGKRLDEQVELLRALWSEPVVDFHGAYHRVDRAGLAPLPPRPVPLWFGGFSKPALRRAARLGDGFFFGSSPSHMQGLMEGFRACLEEEGRDPASVPCDAVVDASQSPDEWQRQLELWRELGGSHLSLRAMDTAAASVGFEKVGFSGPGAYIEVLERFAEVCQ